MKGALFIIMIGYLVGGSPLFGQDLTYYAKTGKLTPVSPGSITEHSLLIYKNRGLVFHMSQPGRGILSVSVFQPRIIDPPGGPAGMGIVTPGVSACGIMLGMSPDQVDATLSAMRSKKMAEDARGAFYQLQGRRTLMVLYTSGRATQVEVTGPFATTEGITDRSGRAEIQQAYGMPDEQYSYELRSTPWMIPATILVMPLFGLLTGIGIRKTRGYATGVTGGLALLAILGAVGMAAAGIVSCVAMSAGTGLAGEGIVWYHLAHGALAGASGVLLMEFISPRLEGRLRSIVTLAAMLIAARIAALIVGAFTTTEPTSSLRSFSMSAGSFLAIMFAMARGKEPA